MEIRTSQYILTLSEQTGALHALRPVTEAASDLLVAPESTRPLFVVQYLNHEQQFCQMSSAQAHTCEIERDEHPTETTVQLRYRNFAEFDIDVDVTVRCPHDEQLSYWSLKLTQRAPLTITDVQFPFAVVPYRYDGTGSTALLIPRSGGVLYCEPRPEDLTPDASDAWQFGENQFNFGHYPGTTFAQFLAYYHDRAGVYLGCHDTTGAIKLIKPVHHRSGIRLGIAHVTGWDAPGVHQLGYETVLGVFHGDWYDAADIYRRWYLAAAQPADRLDQRSDVPEWLRDSPLHVVLRIQGELDQGPAEPHPEFVPYENALPLLDRLAEQVDAPVTPIIMSWEHPGPWVYPESFPVAGGDESLRAFAAAARERGWHVGTYCNGTRWVIEHKWTGYDGRDYYERERGEETICRLPGEMPWREGWDRAWRPSYTCCAAVPRTQEIAATYVQRLLDLGLDWIQFLDQNCGASAFPCYSAAHGHPAAPGSWMTGALEELLVQLEARAAAADRAIVYSVEQPPNDHFRPHFQICDIRPDLEGRDVPLYHYLFHEHILTQAAFGMAPNPYWMELKTAHSFVMGDVLTAIMGPGGRLMNWVGYPWAVWDTPEGDQDAVLTLLRRAIAVRRGVGRHYLVFGQLLRPLPIAGIAPIAWTHERKAATMPAVFHARWQAPNRQVAVALANWTRDAQHIRLEPTHGGRPRSFHLQTERAEHVALDAAGSELLLPPLSVALVEFETEPTAARVA